MERQVIFRDRQEAQAADFTAVQEFVRISLDDIVRDSVGVGKAFAGFLVTQRSPTEIDIQPGRLYRAGAVFAREDALVKDLFSSLPTTVKRIVTVVTWGNDIETDVQPRDFLVDAETRLTEPQAVAMERRRYAMVETVAGIESASPQPPVLDLALLPIAHVTLGTTGILGIEMLNGANGLPNIVDLQRRIKELEDWRAITEPRISTIASDIAALANRMSGLTELKRFSQAAQDLALIKDKLRIADNARDFASDHFLTAEESDTAATGYSAKVQEGVRFPDAAVADVALDLFNPLDASSKLYADGMLLPVHDHVARLDLKEWAGELSVSQYQFQTFNMVRRSLTRRRIRFGPVFTVCTNSAWWSSGMIGTKRIEKDPGFFHVVNTLTRDGETFQIENYDELVNQSNKWIRLKQYWVDTYEEPYWDKVTTPITVNGSQIAQTFLNSQDGWLTQVELAFTKLGPDGNVTVSICECYRGAPDLEMVVSHVTVQRADLKLFPASKTKVDIPPVFMQAGKRYAILITSGGNHFVATVSGGDYAQGTLFYSTDGAYFQADLTRDLMFTLRYARFTRTYTEVALKPLQLAGGITGIDILHEGFTPASCELRFEVQVNGRWFTLDQYDSDCLNGLPAILPLRAVFLGTHDVMPGIRLAGSRARVNRPATALKHYSIARSLGTPSTTVRVESRLEHFKAALHTATVKLKIGADEVAATTVADKVEDAAGGIVLRTSSFTLAVATSAYQIIHQATTTSVTNLFHIADRFDQSF